MNKDEMVKLILQKIENRVAAAGKTADWAIAKQSVVAQIVDGIAEGVGIISEEIQAGVPPKAKINELVSYMNMMRRRTNLSTDIPTAQDNQGPIQPLT